ncbi:MAG TPA: 7-carboxy-7-deazaguanine synthase QueE [Phycisphaerae bacterium]|nr:7-carboxy-7-deazaguanine synthase QueE [Phycisphaerae bacterium]HNU47119.1 7-carboxy-7-deazaguanine synthase QueE [Phycisphaerae bacterium]
MKVSELFYSIQGEGKLAGLPSAFIRVSGCNLRCAWCDTPFSSWEPEGEELEVADILDRLADHPTQYVVLTGGEPLIMPGIEELTRRLHEEGYHVTLETAGTVWRDVVCDLISVSPKLANSTPWEHDDGRWAEAHEEHRLNIPVIRRLLTLGDYQLKFVLQELEDMAEVDLILGSLDEYEPTSVLLMPQGVTAEEVAQRSRWIVPICTQRGFRYCPRLQISIFGNVRGT